LPAICASGALRSSPAFRNGLDGIHTEASSQHRWHPVIFPKPLAGWSSDTKRQPRHATRDNRKPRMHGQALSLHRSDFILR